MIKKTHFDISNVEHKMPEPFLKDVKYTDTNGNTKTIKGFLGSVKNIKAVNDKQCNYLQPLKNTDQYENTQISLSSFFVDKNNQVYGIPFAGTIGHPYTILFAIPQQNNIIPVCHKKQDIQIPIVGNNTNDWERNKNKEAIEKVKKILSMYYNINNQQSGRTIKLKFFNEKDNCLEKIYEKYQKLNDKIKNNRITDTYKYQYKYQHTLSQKKIKFNDEEIQNVYHDELLAVPKNEDYKTYFNCGIITSTEHLIEHIEDNIEKNFFIQAQCGYPYVVILNSKNNKLEYKLMSEYVKFIKHKLATQNENCNQEIKKLEQKPDYTDKYKYYLKSINETLEKIINNIMNDKKKTEKEKEEEADKNFKQCTDKCLKELVTITDPQNQTLTPEEWNTIWSLYGHIENIKDKYYSVNAVWAKRACENAITYFSINSIKTQKKWIERMINKNNEKIKYIESIDLDTIKNYEERQIDYILNQKCKKYNCDLPILEEAMKTISKSNNKATQLNCLINYENEVRKKIKEIKKCKYYQQYLNVAEKRDRNCRRLKGIRTYYIKQARKNAQNKKAYNLKFQSKVTKPI